MNNRKTKIIGYVLYLILVLGLSFFLFLIRDQYNWVAGALRELFTYLIIGLVIIYTIISVLILFRNRTMTVLFYGLFGLIPFFISIPFFKSPIFEKPIELTGEIKTIELTYIAWACDCANWVTDYHLTKFSNNTNDSLAYYSIYIEPMTEELKLPDSVGFSNDIIKFKGQFYKNRGFPKDFIPLGDPESSRIFRYSEFEIIKSNHHDYQIELTNY